jgi:predicted anti-sigma-YlaC factor YlaD
MSERPESATIKCEEIQAQLMTYLTREMGEGRLDLIREHLKKCPDCQAEAAQVRETLGFLHDASATEGAMPTRLSAERRALIVRAYLHPVLDAVYRHHIVVSIVVTILALILVGSVLRKVKAWHTEKLDPGIPITIGGGPPELPGMSTNR